MAPPNVHNSGSANANDWSNDSAPSLDTSKASCPGNCHSSPASTKPFPDFQKKPLNSWFFDQRPKSNPFSDQQLKGLQSWLDTNGKDPKANPNPPTITPPPPVPDTKVAATVTAAVKPKPEVVDAA